ncbi:MAG: hypothetical protein HY644_02425 [Acidobacteria bacterium]|nr:hypothetical protein [Acidobacteriota bacterium]
MAKSLKSLILFVVSIQQIYRRELFRDELGLGFEGVWKGFPKGCLIEGIVERSRESREEEGFCSAGLATRFLRVMSVKLAEEKMEGKYSLSDVVKSYRWLGHRGWTELNAIHPDYQVGKENYGWNLKHGTFPKVSYARSEKEIVSFVEKFSDSRICCFGINARSKIFTNDRGYARSAVESEIEISQNLLLDFDFETRKISDAQAAAAREFLKRAVQYFLDMGLLAPAKAATGRGYHLLFAYPGVLVRAHRDISERLGEFRDRFSNAYRREMADLEIRLDKTQDLRRMVRIYGTAKPTIGIVSKFYGGERVEDEKLRDHLLALQMPEAHSGVCTLRIGDELPSSFRSLLDRDKELKDLWYGRGKPDGTDTSRSGFDYSIARRLIRLGYRNIDEIATVLILRPNGGVKASGKAEGYVRRTIASALMK